MGSVANALIALNSLLAAAQSISQIVTKAQQEGRTDLTAEEWATIGQLNASSAQGLDDAIKQAGG
jgi:exoribonuclease R